MQKKKPILKEELAMKIFQALLIFCFLIFFLWGCGGGGGSGATSFTPTGKIIAVAERSDSTIIKVGGTKGAAPAGSTVQVTDLNTGVTMNTTAASDGSFDPTLTGNTSDMFKVVVSNNSSTVTNVTIGVTIISQSVTRKIARLGSTPDAIEIRGNKAYVLNGLSDNVQVFNLDQNPPHEIGTIVLPPSSDPAAIAFLDETHAYVANNIGQSVAMVNTETMRCELLIVRSDLVPSDASTCQNQVTTVDPKFFAGPSGIGIANNKVYVTNSNLDQFFNPAGNGFITIINTQTNGVNGSIQASGADSGSITPINGNLYVVNGGHTIFNASTDTFSCDSNFPPSIDVINTQSDTVIATIGIQLDSNNPLVCLPNVLEPTPDGRFGYIGLGFVGALLKVDLKNNTLINGPSNPIIITDLSGLNFTADIKIRNDGLGFVALFNTDQIAVLDTATDTIDPFPFIAPFPAGERADNPSSSFFEGVLNLAIRPGRPGTDFQGPDIFFITNISQALGSINTALVQPPE
jgi:hypothetical protein